MSARKPTTLKLLAGTGRPDRAAPAMPALPVLDTVPSPPAWMANTVAISEWLRLAPVLVANRLLHHGNIGLLGQLCALHAHLIQAWASDTPPTAALISAFRGLAGDLGLSSMALPSPAGKMNRFSNNRK